MLFCQNSFPGPYYQHQAEGNHSFCQAVFSKSTCPSREEQQGTMTGVPYIKHIAVLHLILKNPENTSETVIFIKVAYLKFATLLKVY